MSIYKHKMHDSRYPLRNLEPRSRSRSMFTSVDDQYEDAENIDNMSTVSHKTFYEGFKESFPQLVRENAKTRMKEARDETQFYSRNNHDLKQKKLHQELQSIEREIESLKIRKASILNELNLGKDLSDLATDSSETEDGIVQLVGFSFITLDAENFPALNHRSMAVMDSCIKTIPGHNLPINSLDFVSIHDVLVTASDDCTVRIWDLGRWKLLRTLIGHEGVYNPMPALINLGPVKCIRYDGKLAASGGDDRKIILWNVPSSSETLLSYYDTTSDDDWIKCKLSGHHGSISCLQIDSSASKLVSGASDSSIKIWDLEKEILVQTLYHLGDYEDMESNPMFSTSPNRRGMPELFGNQTTIGVGALQFYQYAIATGGADGIVRLWDSRIVSSSKRPMQTFNSTVDGIQATKVYQQFSSSPTSPNGSITNPCIRTLAGHTLPITSLHFTDTHLITGSLDRSVRIWDLRNGKIVEGYLGNSANGIMDVQWDNAKVLIAGGESTITIVDRKTRKQHVLNGHASTVRCIKHIGNRLVSAGEDSVVKLWDI